MSARGYALHSVCPQLCIFFRQVQYHENDDEWVESRNAPVDQHSSGRHAHLRHFESTG